MDAFWTLYKEKAIEKISIAEITRITGNNRGTFYHYFKDVYAVLEQIEADLLQQVNREVSEALPRNSPLCCRRKGSRLAVFRQYADF